MKTQGELPLLIVKKILISFMVVILVSVLFGGWNCAIGATPINNTMNIQLPLQQTQVNFIDETLTTVEQELEAQGFTVVSTKMDMEKLVKQASQITVNKNSGTSDLAQSCVEATVAATKITIDTEDYYFKSEADATALEEILEKNNIKYTKEQIETNPSKISSSSSIEKEIEKVKKEAAAKQRNISTVSSRSGTARTSTVISNNGIFPLESYIYISSPYGMRHGKMHTGVDFAASTGTNVYSWKAGVVTNASWSGGYGNFIVVTHYDGTTSRYGHLSGYAVSKGTVVEAGQILGYVGSTGNSTGPHLHFEILVNNNFVSPLNYI